MWDTREDLIDYIRLPGLIKRYIDGELGNNLLYVYRTRAITQCVAGLRDLAREATSQILQDSDIEIAETMEFVEDALTYQSMRFSNIFQNRDTVPRIVLDYDLIEFEKERTPKKFDHYRFAEPKTFDFVLNQEQEDLIGRYLATFGNSTTGIARIVSRVYVKKLYRRPVPISGDGDILRA